MRVLEGRNNFSKNVQRKRVFSCSGTLSFYVDFVDFGRKSSNCLISDREHLYLILELVNIIMNLKSAHKNLDFHKIRCICGTTLLHMLVIPGIVHILTANQIPYPLNCRFLFIESYLGALNLVRIVYFLFAKFR